MAKKIGVKSERLKHPGSENLTPGGPGRPPGQRNYATIYREALINLATKNGMEPDHLETELLEKAILTARKGDYRFYKDILDRLHGTPLQKVDQTTNGKDMPTPIINVLRDNSISQN